MKKLKSPYAVHLLDALTDSENNHFYLVMDLEDFISNNPNISDSQIITMFIDVLRESLFLKENKIIHRYLKP